MFTKYARLLELAITKATMNLRSEAARTYLSYAWWLLEPLMFIAIYYIVFDLLLRRGGEDFVVFLIVGVVHWLWFGKSVANATMSIVQGKGLMAQIDIPKIFFPLVVVIQDSIKQIPVFILLLFFLLIYGIPVSDTWLAWPIIIFCELILIAAVAIIAAAIVPFMQDLRIVISTGLQLMMFLSGVFYSYEIIPEKYLDLFFLNPMARLLYLYREVLMYGNWPDWLLLGEFALGCSIALFVVVLLVTRIDHIYPRLVLE